MSAFDSAKKITVTITGNTTGLNKSFGQAVREADTFGKKMGVVGSTLKGMMGPALIGAGAAAGAFAIKLGVDGVKAAIDEDKQLAILKQTLDNVGQGFAMDSVNKFIDNLRFATGVADDELRPAFEKIVGVTKDAASAQNVLAAAVDASVGSGKDLSSVSAAVAKAIGGQSTALKRLIPGLDVTKIKAGDTASVIAALEDRFGGSASAAAGTFAGQLARVQDGFSELTESFGHGFLDAMNQAGSSADTLAQALRDAQPAAQGLGNIIGTTLHDTLSLIQAYKDLRDAANVGGGVGDWLSSGSDTAFGSAAYLQFTTKTLGLISDGVGRYQNAKAAIDAYEASVSALHPAYVGSNKAALLLTDTLDAMPMKSVTQDAHVMADSFQGLKTEAWITAQQLGVLTGALDAFDKAVAKREAMQSYQQALKDYIADPSKDTMRALESAYSNAARALDDPTKKTKFMKQGLDDIKAAAKSVGDSVPPEVQKLDDKLSSANTKASNLKQALYDIDGKKFTSTVQIMTELVTASGRAIATGGPVYATGGMVHAALGTHASDNVPAMLSRGEYVLNADTVKRLGVGTLNGLNNGGSMGAGLTINGGITVQSAAGERAEESVPRALRRLAFVAGLNG